MTAWFKLLEKRCSECDCDHFYLVFTKLSALVCCERCGTLFPDRPLGPHRVLDHVEPIQLTLIST